MKIKRKSFFSLINFDLWLPSFLLQYKIIKRNTKAVQDPWSEVKHTLAAKVSLSAVGASMGWRGGGAPGARRPHTRRTKRGSSFRMPTTSTWFSPSSFWPFTCHKIEDRVKNVELFTLWDNNCKQNLYWILWTYSCFGNTTAMYYCFQFDKYIQRIQRNHLNIKKILIHIRCCPKILQFEWCMGTNSSTD